MKNKNIPAASARQVYRRLLTYVWPFRYAFMLAILGNVLYGAVDASLIKLFEPLINEGFVNQNKIFIRYIPFIIIGAFVLRGIAAVLSTFFMGWVGRHVVMNLRQAMFKHLLELPTSYYDKITTGEILSKIIYNAEQVADAATDALTVVVRESCMAIALVVVMLSISWRLTLLFVIVAPLMAGVMDVVSKRTRAVSSRVQGSMGGVAHVAEEAIEGQKEIKAFGGKEYEMKQFERVTQYNRRQEMKRIAISAISTPIVQLIGSISLAATVYLATLSPQDGLKTGISPGEFTAMLGAMFSLLKPIKQLTKVNNNIQKGLAGATSIFDFLDEPSEKDEGQQKISHVKGGIVFKDVNFTYDNIHRALEGITFHVKPGETIAIVGRSGGGKSTLVSLLPRFYEASGDILIDGVNIRDIPLSQLRSQIAIVSQHVTLFNDTIARNIAYGRDDVSPEDIIDAAHSAHAMNFIEKLPQGLDTMIGENGVRLSGGQRQRIAIARAILKKAPILILDEATSALDTESERYIQAALDKLMKQCTTLVIAHRLSTIENASRIIVIDQGRIIEMGTHKELMELNGHYAQLRSLQYTPVEPTSTQVEKIDYEAVVE